MLELILLSILIALLFGAWLELTEIGDGNRLTAALLLACAPLGLVLACLSLFFVLS